MLVVKMTTYRYYQMAILSVSACFSHSSKQEIIIKGNSNYDERRLKPVAKTITLVTAANFLGADYTLVLYVYVDCPSVRLSVSRITAKVIS